MNTREILESIIKDLKAYQEKYKENLEIEYYKEDETDYLFYKGVYSGIDSCIRRVQKELR
ncbi:MAG: hypothetical protein ACRC1T_05615 [Clostridium chrysemydis]|uniref:hypothetical protein n=1 Tax=Clostridium chrysemydis TaxID=2665504 RepID=UPI003F40D7FB